MDGLSGAIESSAKALGKIVGASAPLIASVLGTPLAGVAVSLLANAFDSDSKNVADVISKIQSDPECALKLKTLEYEHAETLAKIASQNFVTGTADIQSARANSAQYKDFLRHFAYFVTCGFFGALLILFLPINLSPQERELLSLLIGMLASKWQTIVDFFYGDSESR